MAKTKRKLQYKSNKSAKVGTEIICPICGTKFVKRQYSQAFCNSKCKDSYWNNKADRHRYGYYQEYDNKHPERKIRKALYSMNIVTAADTNELDARMALVTDEGFRRYVNDDCDVCDIPRCHVDLATQYENYLGID
jgi:hypothetical protein